MSRVRKKNSYNRQREANGVGRITPPGKRLRPLFQIGRDMTDAGDYAVAKAGPAQVGTQAQFERTIYMRGVNTLKAARLVAESGHWEIASVCARQLFELVLNMEAIDRAPDRERASITFATYGFLQKMLYQKAEIEYERETGRDYRVKRLEGLEEYLASPIFDEFRITKPGKPDTWAKSWTGLTAWDLAKASSSPMRVPQYNILFKRWSEEAHGAPGAHIDNMFGRVGPNWLDEAIKQDDDEISDVMQMAMLLFIDLWHLLPNAVPFPPHDVMDWTNRIFAWVELRSGKIPDEYRYPRRPDGSYIIAPLAAETGEDEDEDGSRTP